MSVLAQEYAAIRNPALGAMLIWQFATAYSSAHPQKSGPPVQLAYLILPVVWNRTTGDILKGTLTKSGLRYFAGKFGESGGEGKDVLLAIHDRAHRLRPITRNSLRLAVSCGLVGMGPQGLLIPRPAKRQPKVSPAVLAMIDGAEKLGVWFASMTVAEISLALHVRF